MSLIELVILIFTFNLLTFGNGPAMIPMLDNDLVQNAGILSSQQLLYAFAIARVTPGQANVYVASIGYFLFGFLGAMLTTLAIQLPGYLMVVFMRGYEYLKDAPWIKNFTKGLTVASVGLIFAATASIGQRSLAGWIPWMVFLATLAMLYLFKWNTFISLGVGSLVGLLLKLLFGS